jgi:hypothetical protein
MFCHRLLRPIADIRTVAECTDSNAMINRAAAPTDQRVDRPNRRGRMPR